MDIKELKSLIDEQGIRYSFIAKSIGVSKTALSNWLNGLSKIPDVRKSEIMDILRIRNKDKPAYNQRFPFDYVPPEKDTLVVLNEKTKTLKAIHVENEGLLSSDFQVIDYMDKFNADAFILFVISCVEKKNYTFSNIEKKIGIFLSITEALLAASKNNDDVL